MTGIIPLRFAYVSDDKVSSCPESSFTNQAFEGRDAVSSTRASEVSDDGHKCNGDIPSEPNTPRATEHKTSPDAGSVVVEPESNTVESLDASIQINAEVEPVENCTTDNNDEWWRVPVENFTHSSSNGQLRRRGMKNSVKKYYKQQESLIEQFAELAQEQQPAPTQDGPSSTTIRNERIARICARTTFLINVMLLLGKIIASVLSGSLSIISSLVDSCVDLVSGVVMWITSSVMKKRDVYKYPGGKKRLEPVAILILSVIMSMASAMVIVTAIQQIQTYATSDDPDVGPDVDQTTIILISVTIVVKLVMFLIMRRYNVLSVQALAQDHRNDVVSNSTALVMGIIGTKFWAFADPIGAIIIAFYILTSWCITAYEQIQMLTGKTADPDFLKKITWMAMNHHPAIEKIDYVTVFHLGQQFLAEVHIVLPGEMQVREAHDIQESLQSKLEQLEEVDRAFVHIDHDTCHHRDDEHKAL